MPQRLWNTLSFLILVLATVSTPEMWEQVDGPAGGQALAIIQWQGCLFAGAAMGGIFRSDDDGASWYHLDRSSSWEITVLASKGDTLFAGTRYSGVFLSADSGKNWINTYTSDNQQDRNINAVTVIDNFLYISTAMSILRSSDNGRTWARINDRNDFPQFYYCKGFIKTGTSHFAWSSQGYGIIRSCDSGATWRTVNNGLFDSNVYACATIDSVIFAGTYQNNVFRSTDYGTTWEHCSNGLPPDSSSCYFLYADGSSLFATIGKSGLCISNDYGTSWKVFASTTSYNPRISGMVKIAANRYVGTGVCAGIYRISLDGMMVTPENKGFNGRIILSLASDSSTLVASSYYYNTSLSPDNGYLWRSVIEKEYVNAYATFIKGNSVYTGTRGDGIFRSDRSGSKESELQSVDIDQETFLDIRDFGAIGRYTLACGGDEAVYRKSDNESLWKRCNSGITPKDYFTAIGENKGRLFLAGFDFYVSDDSATTWKIKIPRGSGRFNGLATAGNNVYTAGDHDGVFRSPDNGTTWNEPAVQLPDVKTLAAWNTVVFAGTGSGGVFFSRDSAKTWTPLNDGLFNFSITSLTIQNSVLFAGTEGNGIFMLNLAPFTETVAAPQYNRSIHKNALTVSRSGNFYTVAGGKGAGTFLRCDLLGRNSENTMFLHHTNASTFSFSIKGTSSSTNLLKIIDENGSATVPISICK